MENIESYKNRFFNLMESTIGDVKPIITNEHKRPHYNDNKTIQYMPIQNFDNLVKLGFRKNASGDAYIGTSNNVVYTFHAKGTNGNGTYYANKKSGQWRFDDGTACASNFPNCKIFKGVKLVTPVSSK